MTLTQWLIQAVGVTFGVLLGGWIIASFVVTVAGDEGEGFSVWHVPMRIWTPHGRLLLRKKRLKERLKRIDDIQKMRDEVDALAQELADAAMDKPEGFLKTR